MGNEADRQPGRVIIAALLTVLVPGAGHFVLKRWRSGAAWSIGFALTAFIGWQLVDIETKGALFDPAAIRRALLVNGFLAVLRIAALVDVLWVTNSFASALAIGLSALAILATLFPHVFLHVRGHQAIEGLEGLFVAEAIEAEPALLEAPTTTATTTRIASAQTSTTLAGDLHPHLSAPLEPEELIAYFEQRQRLSLGVDGRFTVILLGSDEGPGRSGARTDAMIVASLDPWTLEVSLFSIPRNWSSVPMPDEWPGSRTHSGPSNSIYRYGWTHGDTLFPGATDPGAETLKVVLGNLMGLEIDHYWKVTMAGFVDFVDAFGGVELNVQLPISNEFSHPENPDEFYYVKLEVGVQTLDGLEALAYSRSRRTTNDYHRMGRQRCVVAAIGQQIGPADLLFGFRDVLAALEDHVSTDIPLATVPALVDVASLVDLSEITTVAFVPPEYYDNGGPDIEKVRRSVAESLLREGDTATELVTSVEGTC